MLLVLIDSAQSARLDIGDCDYAGVEAGYPPAHGLDGAEQVLEEQPESAIPAARPFRADTAGDAVRTLKPVKLVGISQHTQYHHQQGELQ